MPKGVQVKNVAVPTEAPKVDSGLVVRTIIYLIAIINTTIAFFGGTFEIAVPESFVYDAVTLVFMFGAFAQAYWKNNDISKKARIEKEVKKQI